MRTDARELRRPVGAVLRPLGLLAAAIVIGLGMWQVLTWDDGRRGARHDRFSIGRLGR